LIVITDHMVKQFVFIVAAVLCGIRASRIDQTIWKQASNWLLHVHVQYL